MNIVTSGKADIALGQATSGTPAMRDYMLTGPAIMQDITPASTRRSDGDARYQLVQTESYWSQNDWSAGYGLVYPPDPTSWQSGPVDTLTPHRLRPALQCVNAQGGMGGAGALFAVAHEGNTWIAAWDGTGTGWVLYYLSAAGALAGAFALPARPTALVSFRGQVIVAYGSNLIGNYVQGYTTAGLATTYTWTADLLCPYTSMLFYVHYNASAGGTYAINRHDPENPATTVGDLGKFSIAQSTKPVALVAIGADLYATFPTSLWRFSSANGNSGILTGPLDTWAPAGGPQAATWSGKAIGFQGALYYSVGGYLRRYQPGGSARTVWPQPERESLPGTGQMLDLGAFAVANDRLFVLGLPSATVAPATTRPCLLAWDGVGMHQLAGWSITVAVAGFADALALAARPGTNRLFAGLAVGAPTAGTAMVSVNVGQPAERAVEASTTWTSARQDFGMLDIDKSLRLVGVSATCPANFTIGVSVRTENGTYALAAGGGFPLPGSPPKIVYYALPAVGAFDFQVLVAKNFEFIVTFSGPAGSTSVPEVYAVNAIPNPVNPVRRGFHFTIELGATTTNNAGERLFDGGDAEVLAELATLRAWRASGVPVALAWQDGASYYCRINTLTIARVQHRLNTQATYQATLDMQELS